MNNDNNHKAHNSVITIERILGILFILIIVVIMIPLSNFLARVPGYQGYIVIIAALTLLLLAFLLRKQDKVKIIIDELSTSLIHESNLMSYLDSNIKLLDYEIKDNIIKLNFNDLILSDITSNTILEEVMYTIGLSLYDELNVEKVIFEVNNQEISTFYPKTLD